MIYVIDTSTWIDFNRAYPKHIFGGLWRNIGDLIKNGNIQSPLEVKNELKKNVDELSDLFKQNSNVFQKDDLTTMTFIREIIQNYPCAVDTKKKIDADPHTIALARKIKKHTIDSNVDHPIIVTQENQDKQSQIPYVARQYGLKSIKLIGLFELKGWHFD